MNSTMLLLPTAPGLDYRREEIPEWLQTKFIDTGYRANLSFVECFQSIFAFHNETVAIWTHLLPAILCAGLALSFLVSHHRHGVLFAQTSFAFAIVFSASAFMHTFNPINEAWSLWTLGLDWGAIAFVIYGVSHSLSTLAYYHDQKRQDLWKILMFIPCSVFAGVASWSGFHALPNSTKVCLVFLPLAVGLAFSYDLSQQLPANEWQVVKSVMRTPALLTIAGIIVYGSQFPERQFPEISFDVSRGHHLFHHLWSSAFAVVYLRNTWQWAQKIGGADNKKQC